MKKKDNLIKTTEQSTNSAFIQLKRDIENRKAIHFVGIGGAGAQVVTGLMSLKLNAAFSIINDSIDFQANNDINFIEYIPPGRDYFKDGTIKYCRIEDYPPIAIGENVKDIFASKQSFILVAGFGGYTGTFFSNELANWLTSEKKDFNIICSLPFKFEISRRKIAKETLHELKSMTKLQWFDNEQFRIELGDKPITKVFKYSNDEFCKLCFSLYKSIG